MDNQYDEGGVGQVECYLKARYPSPCTLCGGLQNDKEACSSCCKELLKWQVMTGALPLATKAAAVRRVDSNGHRLCAECGGRLVYEEGVIFCDRCLAVHMRFEEHDSGKEVEYLLGKDWSITQVALVMDLSEVRVRQLAVLVGLDVGVYYSEAEKAAIVEYMLMYGVKVAAERFGVGKDTINRYARQFGVGKVSRYNRLKQVARQMFRQGVSSRKVASELGINVSTAQNWKKK